jgi:hypothetical protein
MLLSIFVSHGPYSATGIEIASTAKQNSKKNIRT